MHSKARAACGLGVLGILLAGCSTFGPTPVSIPSPKDLAAYDKAIQGLDSAQTVDPLNAGYAFADEQCANFFASLQAARNGNSFASSTLAAGSGATMAIMGITHTAQRAIGVTGAALGFGAATLSNYRQYGLLSQYSAELQDLVQSAQTQYKVNVAKQISAQTTTPSTAQLYDIVVGYAKICGLSSIDSLTHQAIGSAQTVATTEPSVIDTYLQTADKVLGLADKDALTADQAHALVAFAAKPDATSTAAVQSALTAAQLAKIFKPLGKGETVLMPQASASFETAILVLQLIPSPQQPQGQAGQGGAAAARGLPRPARSGGASVGPSPPLVPPTIRVQR